MNEPAIEEIKIMNQLKRTLRLAVALSVPLLFWCACQSLYQGAVTLTGVVDAAAKEYARAFNDGLVPPDLAQKVGEAHLVYRNAAGVAQQALIAYKVSGDGAGYAAALEPARVAALAFIDLIVPLLTSEKSKLLKTQLANATKP